MDADPGATAKRLSSLQGQMWANPGSRRVAATAAACGLGRTRGRWLRPGEACPKSNAGFTVIGLQKSLLQHNAHPRNLPALPKMSQAQNGLFTTYAPGLSKNGCLCSILHGLLQLQIWTAFLLPARLFPTVARQSATQLSHTTFSQVSRPTQGSSFTCTLLFPFPARFSALHYRSPSLAFRPHLHKRAVIAITPQTPPSRLLVRLLPRLGRRYACPGRQVCHRPAGWAFLPVPSAIGEERCHKETPCHFY